MVIKLNNNNNSPKRKQQMMQDKMWGRRTGFVVQGGKRKITMQQAMTMFPHLTEATEIREAAKQRGFEVG